MIAPITRSAELFVPNNGVCAVVPDAVLPPAAPSTTDPTPDHSDTFTAAAFAADNVTVTLDTDGAPNRYHNSTLLFVPVKKPAAPFTHTPPAESVTPVTDAELAAANAIDATNASPDVDADDNESTNVAPLPLATFCCTNATGPPPPPPPDDTVTDTVPGDESTVPSFALYVNESDPVYPDVDVYVPPLQSLATVADPCAGCDTIEHVNTSPSTSDTLGTHDANDPDTADTDTPPATGG